MLPQSIHDLYDNMNTAAHNSALAKTALEDAQRALDDETHDGMVCCDHRHYATLLNAVERAESELYRAQQVTGSAMIAHSNAVAAKRGVK